MKIFCSAEEDDTQDNGDKIEVYFLEKEICTKFPSNVIFETLIIYMRPKDPCFGLLN